MHLNSGPTTALLAAPGLAPALGLANVQPVSDPCTGGDQRNKLNNTPAVNGGSLFTKTRLHNGVDGGVEETIQRSLVDH